MSINSVIPQEYAANVPAIDTADGSIAQPNSGGTPPTGCTLLASHTYVFILGGTNSQLPGTTPLAGAGIKWDASIVITSINVEECFFPAKAGGEVGSGARDDVKDWDTAKGNWMRLDPSTAFVSVTSTDGTTGAATVTNATIATTGGTAGGGVYDVGNMAGRRLRIKVVVGVTGGNVRVGVNGKVAAA